MSIIFTKIQKLQIDEVGRDGLPLVDKRGEVYKRVTAFTTEYPDGMSKLCYQGYKNPELEMETEKLYWLKIDVNGNGVNFRIASKTDVLEARVEKLEKAILKASSLTGAPIKGIESQLPDMLLKKETPQATLTPVTRTTPNPTTSQPLNKKEVGDEPEYSDEPLFDENGQPIPF